MRNSSLTCRSDSRACVIFFESRRVNVAKREVFEFAANFAHAEPVRDRPVDFNGLARDAFAPFRLLDEAERPHVVQPVRQLHDDDANIVHHRQQHFAEAFRLPLLRRKEIELAQLGDAVHAAGHVLAEILVNILDGDAGVFYHVVQQARLDAHYVHPHVRQVVRHHEGVNHVGVAGIPGLQLVMFGGKAEGLLDGGKIIPRPCFVHLGHEIGKQLFYGRLRRCGHRRSAPGFRRNANARLRSHNLIVRGVRCQVLGAS